MCCESRCHTSLSTPRRSAVTSGAIIVLWKQMHGFLTLLAFNSFEQHDIRFRVTNPSKMGSHTQNICHAHKYSQVLGNLHICQGICRAQGIEL